MKTELMRRDKSIMESSSKEMHAEMINHLRELRLHVEAIDSSFHHISEYVKRSVEPILNKSTTSSDNVFLSDMDNLSRGLHNSTEVFQSYIEDLLLMSNAMEGIVENSPNELPPLVINLYCTLTHQLTDYYNEVSECCIRHRRSIEANKVNVMKRVYEMSSKPSSSSSSSLPLSPATASSKPIREEDNVMQSKSRELETNESNHHNNSNDKIDDSEEDHDFVELPLLDANNNNHSAKKHDAFAISKIRTQREVQNEESANNDDESTATEPNVDEPTDQHREYNDINNAHKRKRRKQKTSKSKMQEISAQGSNEESSANNPERAENISHNAENNNNKKINTDNKNDNDDTNVNRLPSESTQEEREKHNVSSRRTTATSHEYKKKYEEQEVNTKLHKNEHQSPFPRVSDEKGNSAFARSQEDEIAALTTVAAVSALRQKTHELDKPLPSHPVHETEALLLSTPASALSNMRHEPRYLQLTSSSSSIQDAMGHLILASRPTVFTNIDSFTQVNPLVTTYNLQLNRSGSLAFFILNNYINPNEDAQADLLCEVLETDEVELGSFESAEGEVSVSEVSELERLPWCGWRVCNNEERSNILYTMYLLVERIAGNAERVLYVQDVCIIHDHRDEVLHVITLLPNMPQFAKVEVYTHASNYNTNNILLSSLNNVISSSNSSVSDNTSKKNNNSSFVSRSKAVLIISFTRSMFVRNGCREVLESEIHSILNTNSETAPNSNLNTSTTKLKTSSPTSSTAVHKLQMPPRTEIDATEAFQPNVQLASLDEPAGGGAGMNSFNFGNVAKGAVKGGLDLLMAPLNISKAVGGAVLDVTGVTDAMKTSLEQTFYKAFPKLIYEHVIDTYNCAWSDSSIPKQGVLFVTSHWLCFQSNINSSQFAIEYDEIKDVKKAKTAKLFDTAISIITHLNETYELINFIQRDQAFSLIMQQWVKQEKEQQQK